MTLPRLIWQRVLYELWEHDIAGESKLHRGTIITLRMFYVMVRDLHDGQLSLRAMSLVYTTLLSLVPVIALSFSVLKGLGLHSQMEPLLARMLTPLGPKGPDLAHQLFLFVDQIKAGVLGSLGLLLLIYTAVSLVHKLEDSFNSVWRVQQARNMVRRMSGYLATLLLGPLLVIATLGVAATLRDTAMVKGALEISFIGQLAALLGMLLPYAIIVAVFTVVYVSIPNTRVRLHSALVGALVAGILWRWIGLAFAALAGSSTQYDAIYSGFAIVLLFMIWMYVSWLVLLFGAQIAFYAQNPRLMTRYHFRLQLGGRLREKLALLVMYLVGDAYYRQQPPWTLESLSDRLRVTGDALETVAARLSASGLLLGVDTDNEGFVPGRDMGTIRLREIVAAVRDPGNFEDHPEHYVQSVPAVDSLVGEIEDAITDAFGGRTLRDLVATDPEPLTGV
jgi:membrane protein